LRPVSLRRPGRQGRAGRDATSEPLGHHGCSVSRPDEEHDAAFPSLFPGQVIETYQIDLGEEIIYDQRGLAILEAVTSSPRAMEGKQTTFSLKNETHHWLENNDGIAMSDVIERDLVKARCTSSS
jgi:hypothetical protein